jgi:hypothetical protein
MTALRDEAIVHNTVKLLNEVYNGTTKQKQMEADNLKDKQGLVAYEKSFRALALTGYRDGNRRVAKT